MERLLINMFESSFGTALIGVCVAFFLLPKNHKLYPKIKQGVAARSFFACWGASTVGFFFFSLIFPIVNVAYSYSQNSQKSGLEEFGSLLAGLAVPFFISRPLVNRFFKNPEVIV